MCLISHNDESDDAINNYVMGLFGHNVLLLVIIYLHYDSMIATESPISELRYDPNIVYVSVYTLTHIAVIHITPVHMTVCGQPSRY